MMENWQKTLPGKPDAQSSEVEHWRQKQYIFHRTGLLVLKASRFIKSDFDYIAILDLKPALEINELDKRIQKDFLKYQNKEFKNSLNDLLPQKIIPLIIKLSGISENKKVNVITKEERKNLVYVIKNIKMNTLFEKLGYKKLSTFNWSDNDGLFNYYEKNL